MYLCVVLATLHSGNINLQALVLSMQARPPLPSSFTLEQRKALMTRIQDAGTEVVQVRQGAWHFGQGFPKYERSSALGGRQPRCDVRHDGSHCANDNAHHILFCSPYRASRPVPRMFHVSFLYLLVFRPLLAVILIGQGRRWFGHPLNGVRGRTLHGLMSACHVGRGPRE